MITQEQKEWMKAVKLSEIREKALAERNKNEGFKSQYLALTCGVIGNMRGWTNIPLITIILLQERLLSEIGPAVKRAEELADEATKWINM